MVELKNNKTGKIVATGEITKETKENIKLHSSSKFYSKKKHIIQYLIITLIFLNTILIIISCEVYKKHSKKELENIKKTDSFAKEQKFLHQMDFKENYQK